MGKRIDVLLLIGPAILVIEFKIGEKEFTSYAIDQVLDYALDLKHFHETSHQRFIAPILIATKAENTIPIVAATPQNDKLLCPIRCNVELLGSVIENVLHFTDGDLIVANEWEEGRYSPTPTIIEAAMALYKGHSVADISRSDAAASNLNLTSNAVSEIIYASKAGSFKSICFVTGVPGAGKTLVGLNIATKHTDKGSDLHSIFLSGNGPLVDILREALARDKIQTDKEHGRISKRGEARRDVKVFIQNVHHFRDDCLRDPGPPLEHIALFDEAQRAWDLKQTTTFMRQKKNKPNFSQSEPEFLISCLDRHLDWAVIVCLVGGGQEIHTGEAGIGEWIESLNRSFPEWHIFLSSRLTDSEYSAGGVLEGLITRPNVVRKDELHLSSSMRSFRAENVSKLMKQLLDFDMEGALETFETVKEKYPIVITRDLPRAKQWLRNQARGSERYGIVVSSQAERLKPHAINVKSPMNPIQLVS